MISNNIIGTAMLGLKWAGQESSLLAEHEYLFITKRGDEPFIFSQKTLHELNDFCVTIYQALSEKQKEEINIENQIAKAEQDDDDDYLQERYAVSMLSYSEIGKIYVPASSLVLLYASFIRMLQYIAKYYDEKSYIAEKSVLAANKDKRDELTQLFCILENQLESKIHSFHDTRVRVLLSENMRAIRNHFLHGDWEKVEEKLIGIRIKSCFEVIKKILDELETKFTHEKFPMHNRETFFDFPS